MCAEERSLAMDRISGDIIIRFRTYSASLSGETYLFTIAALALSLLLGSWFVPTSVVEAKPLASCNGYCYAIADWPNPIYGTSMEVEIGQVSCGSCTGHLQMKHG